MKLDQLPEWVGRAERECKGALSTWANQIGNRVHQPTVAEILDLLRKVWRMGYKAGLGQ